MVRMIGELLTKLCSILTTEDTEEHRGRDETVTANVAKPLCPLCPLWLIIFTTLLRMRGAVRR